MPLCPHPPLLPGLHSHSYLLMASAETVYPAFAIGDKVPTQLPDLKEELAGGEEPKRVCRGRGESHRSQTGAHPILTQRRAIVGWGKKALFARNLSRQRASGQGLRPGLN